MQVTKTLDTQAAESRDEKQRLTNELNAVKIKLVSLDILLSVYHIYSIRSPGVYLLKLIYRPGF